MANITPQIFTPQRPKKNLIKIIIRIIVVLIIGAGISLAARIWDPLWNPFRPEPEEVIEEMAKKMAEVKTLHSEIKFDFGAREKEKEVFKTTMNFKSDSDVTDSKNPKSAGDFNIAMTFNGVQISLAGETITIGDISYFKLTTIPAPSFFETMGIDFSAMENQWIKYDEESYLKTMYGGEIPPEMAEEIEKSKEKEEEMIKKLETIFKDKKLYIVKKELPDEKIKNQKVYHYLVVLNKEEIKKILPELLDIMKEYLGLEESLGLGLSEDILPRIEEFFDIIEEIPAELWIGKKDNYLYKVKVEKEIDFAKFVKSSQPGSVVPRKVIFKVDINFSNFNQPVKIETPEEYKTLEEILPSIYPPEEYFDYPSEY